MYQKEFAKIFGEVAAAKVGSAKLSLLVNGFED